MRHIITITLSSAIVKDFDTDNGHPRLIKANILEFQDGRSYYLTDDEDVIKNYESDPTNKELEVIEIMWKQVSKDELEFLIKLFSLDVKVNYHRTIYERVQHYGGAEEGGWWYHNTYLTDFKEENLEDDDLNLNSRGEGYKVYEEIYRGQFEKTDKEYYC